MDMEVTQGTHFTDLMAQAKALEAKAIEMRDAEKGDVIVDMLAAIADYGITQSDLFPVKVKIPKVAKIVGPAKYKSLAGGMTWTGKGRKPAWVTAYLVNGVKLEELLI